MTVLWEYERRNKFWFSFLRILDIFIPVLKLKGDSFCPYIFCIMINSGVRHDENLHNYGQNLQGQKKHEEAQKM